ncbi:hypothetical protein Tco_0679459 [Tanacetum coccineum]|uniref:Uncharacterized protein n=1 Tax=Tanacetum coccineum TaxID=301880 RepID=A0ABQ4XIN6_9ASTR
MDLCSPMRVQSINGKKYILGFVPISESLLIPDASCPRSPPPVILTSPSVSISFDHDAPSGSHSPSSSAPQSSSVHHGVATEHSFEVNPFAETEHELFVNVFAPDRTLYKHHLLEYSRDYLHHHPNPLYLMKLSSAKMDSDSSSS